MINVISYINIDHRDGALFTAIDEVDDILNGERDDIYAVAINDKNISFELSGNKGVDYSVVDRVKNILLKNGVKFEINGNEYAEVGDGYHFDTEEREGLI